MYIKAKLLLIITLLAGLLLSFRAICAQEIKPAYKQFKPFTMAFIPDIHLSSETRDGWILHKESLVIFQDTLKSLHKTKGLNFIVFGGDLLDNRDQQYDNLPIMLDMLSEVKIPYYVIPGNRDMDFSQDYIKRDFLDEFNRTLYEDKEKTYFATEPVPNVLLIGLDTTIINNFSGTISKSQMQWLDDKLKANKDKITIITMHHPAFPITKPEEKAIWQDFMLTNSDEFLNLISKYPQVKLVLSGHHHIAASEKVNNTIFISSPSTITYPNQFSLLTIYPDKVKITNKPISFNQIIKKAKKSLPETDYAKKYSPLDLKQIIKIHNINNYTEYSY